MLTTFENGIKLIIFIPLNQALKNIIYIYKINKLKSILIIVGFLLILLISFFFSHKVFTKTEINFPHNNVYSNNLDVHKSMGALQVNGVANFIESYKKVIEFFKPIFDGFISTTADPTGKSIKNGNKYVLDLHNNSRIIFSNGDSSISSEMYSGIALEIIIPLLTLLLLLNGFNLIYNKEESSEEIKELFKRLILTLSALILTPFILSLSIISTNLISQRFTDDKPLTTFMINFLDEIKKDKKVNPPDDLKSRLDGLINMSLFNLPTFIESLPLLIPLTLIILLFLSVAFQFIIRFLNLFFLSCIYPFVMIFYISSNTSQIPSNYWKQWLIYLLHQPAFVIGYSIIQNILNDMLRRNGANFVQVLLFLSLLLFLSTINTITSAIFVDVYAAAGNSMQSGLGTIMNRFPNLRTHHRRYSPVTYIKRMLGLSYRHRRRYGSSLFPYPYGLRGLRSIVYTTRRGVGFGNKLNKFLSRTGIFGPNTDISNKLHSQKFKVKGVSAREGILGVSGSFFSYKNPKNAFTTMYSSEKNAIQDGVNSKELKRVDVNNLKIKDLSNKDTTREYNDRLKLFGLKNKIDTTKIKKFGRLSSEKSIAESMNLFSSFNKQNGLDGFAFEKSNRSIGGDPQIVKLIVYPKE